MAAALLTTYYRNAIERSGLLAPETLDPYLNALDPKLEREEGLAALCQKLARDRLITPFQARQLGKGRNRGFFLNNKFKLLDFIAAGGMGKVFLCEHLILHRLVAVKLLRLTEREGEIAGSSVVERFYREARAVAALKDPNIVGVMDLDWLGSTPFMVMEYVDGTNLHDIVSKHGALSMTRAAHYISQAAAGLQHAHEVGLIHRDIKPGNILLDRSGTIKLLDLGLARFNRDQERNKGVTTRFDNNAVIGTVDFMAPEQVSDGSRVDIRSDIYSLGSTLYFLLTGRVPFPEGSLVEKMYRLQSQAPEGVSTICPNLPVKFLQVLEKMMEKDPAERFQVPGELVLALAEWTRQPIGLPRTVEMPAHPASEYRLGISPARPIATAQEVTPSPRASAETLHDPDADMWKHPELLTPEPSGIIQAVGSKRPAPGSQSAGGPLVGTGHTIRNLVAFFLVAVLGGLVVWLMTKDRNKPDPELVKQPGPESKQPDLKKDPPKKETFAGVIVSSGGSTFVEPIMQKWADIYQQTKNIRIDYRGVGSGKGITGMIDKVYQFGCSDAPLPEELMEEAQAAGGEVLHIPLVLGAVVATYNVPDLDQPIRLTGQLLADIFAGKIKRWNDREIQIVNRNLKLPDLPITVVHRAEASGTTSIFTDYLCKVSPEWKTKIGCGTDVKWPIGLEGSGNIGVAGLVRRNTGAIGYVELNTAKENDLRFARLQNRKGEFIEANPSSVTAAVTASLKDIPDDLRLKSLTDADGTESYPIVGVSHAILFVDQSKVPKGKEVADFLRWATSDAQFYVKEMHFAPLPPELQKRIADKLGAVQLK